MATFPEKSASVAVLLLAAWFTPAAWASGSITLDVDGETEHQKVIRLADALEQNPDAENSKQAVRWLLTWATDTKDITIVVCDVLGPIPQRDDVPNGPQLLLQSLFGNAAFQLRNPEQSDDVVATQTAGILSVVRTYRRLLESQPEARIPYFDDLGARLDDGSFERHVEPIIRAKCDAGEDS